MFFFLKKSIMLTMAALIWSKYNKNSEYLQKMIAI